MSNEYWKRFKEAFVVPFMSFLCGALFFILAILQAVLFPVFGVLFIATAIMFCIADGLDRILIAPAYYVITGEKAHEYTWNSAYKRPLHIFVDLVNSFGKWADKCPFCIYGELFN